MNFKNLNLFCAARNQNTTEVSLCIYVHKIVPNFTYSEGVVITSDPKLWKNFVRRHIALPPNKILFCSVQCNYAR